jgi:pre-mRNA cleavage complex 2 protein Pcf11
MIQRLYSGVQCTSCGERFTLKDGEKEAKYRQHLDWHFRQNRRGKTDMKLSSCRKWYYGIDVSLKLLIELNKRLTCN